jgi:para-nitrobenzyl esterase
MTVVATQAGKVRGTSADGLHTFRGIPYAQPPVGALRVAAPVLYEPWDGVLDATGFGPPPPQPMRLTLSDEWLTVNVWTPDVGASGLPIMVWLYAQVSVRSGDRRRNTAGQPFPCSGGECGPWR